MKKRLAFMSGSMYNRAILVKVTKEIPNPLDRKVCGFFNVCIPQGRMFPNRVYYKTNKGWYSKEPTQADIERRYLIALWQDGIISLREARKVLKVFPSSQQPGNHKSNGTVK